MVVVFVEGKGKRAERIRLYKVNDASGTSLIPVVKATVEPKVKFVPMVEEVIGSVCMD